MPLALGLDLGTTSVSVVAIDERGGVHGCRSESHAADVAGLPAGRAEQDPARIRDVAERLLRSVVADLPEPPASLGVTGQMHGLLLVDADRRPLGHLVTWQDRRANEPADPSAPDGPTHLDRLLAAAAAADADADADATAIERTGTRPAPGYLGVTLAVCAARGEIPANAHRACCLADWLVAIACDGEPVTAPSHAASTGLYDLQADAWSRGLIAACGVPAELLPRVLAADAIVGHVAPAFAAATGLPVGLPVANAVGDHQASILGSVPTGEPALHVNLGTGGQIDWPVDEFVRVPGMDTRPLPIGRRMLVGAGLAGGDALAWVQRTATAWAAALGLPVDRETVYARMLALAERVPPEGSLVAVPTFRGTRAAPTATGAFTGITNDNFGLGEVTRAVLAGIVTGFHEFVERAGPLAPTATRIIGTGNALDRNPLFTRLLEQRFGLEVWKPRHPEAAACGAALLAGTAVGTWPDLRTAGDSIPLERMAAP